MLSGSIPALVTPFASDGAVDGAAFRDLIDWQIAEGSSALVICGTTGEAATLTAREHFDAVRACVGQASGRVPVIAGAGSNDTRVAIENLRAAKDAGADAALVVAPYYNRPSQEGLYQHFAALAHATPLPLILYNVPARTVADILPATLARIVADFPKRIAGIKDSSGLLPRVAEHRASLGPAFAQLTGNDELALAFNACGGTGCISVTANVAPRLCAEFQAACRAGDYTEALRYQDLLSPLHAALFTDASPGPAKYALARVRPGFPDALRLPMAPPGAASRDAVDAALAHAGLARMPIHICKECGTSYADAPSPPARCPICEDERQYVPRTGQAWSTPAALSAEHVNTWRLLEPDLFEIHTQPDLAIGQRALLVRTPAGNFLWDCIALIDDATVELIRGLGGLAGIAISHPHYYTTCQDWAAAFGCPVHLHAADREWVMRSDAAIRFWDGDNMALGPGATLIRLGGHFPGATVLHRVPTGRTDGILLTGDTLQVVANQMRVTFMYSYPNQLPLSAATVRRIADVLKNRRIDRVYGFNVGRQILFDGGASIERSARRYIELLSEDR